VTQIESIYWIAPGPTPEPSGWSEFVPSRRGW
jgi:hypothetical protein